MATCEVWACWHEASRIIRSVDVRVCGCCYGEPGACDDEKDDPHELSDSCVCGPRAEIEVREGRRDKHIYVHASLDGREQREGAA